MTFDEWWENSWWKPCAEKGDVFKVWQSATLAERERAAKVAETTEQEERELCMCFSGCPNCLIPRPTIQEAIAATIRKGEGV